MANVGDSLRRLCSLQPRIYSSTADPRIRPGCRRPCSSSRPCTCHIVVRRRDACRCSGRRPGREPRPCGSRIRRRVANRSDRSRTLDQVYNTHTHTHTHRHITTTTTTTVPPTGAVPAMKSEATARFAPQDGRWKITVSFDGRRFCAPKFRH